MSSFPTVATSKTPKMEIRKARPSGDSHGLAYFHLRRLIPCRRKEMTGILDMRYSGIAPDYCATLKIPFSFSLNAAISCPILSLVILA